MVVISNIYVYPSNCEDFTNFGLVGALTPTSCVFEEEANGLSEIILDHPLDAFGKYTHLICNNIIMADVPVRTTPGIYENEIITSVEQWVVRPENTTTKAQRTLYKRKSGSSRIKVLPEGASVTVVEKNEEGRYKVKSQYGTGWMNPDGLDYSTTETIADNSQSIESVQPAWTVKPQFFRIYSVEKNISGVTAMARHISYDLLYNLTTYKNSGSVSCAAALAAVMAGCVADNDFTAYTNLLTERTGINWTRTNPIDALLNPETGLTALYGASLVRDNWEFYVLHDPGMNRGVTVEYGKNMTGITYTESFDDVVTRIIPVGETKDGDDLLLEGDSPWVDSTRINSYPVVYAQELKCENCKVGTDGVTEEIARARMLEQAQQVFNNGGDLPTIEMSVDFINLGDTAEYTQFKNLERLFLWDYVLVRHKLHGIDVTSRIVKIHWDCLLERMQGMEVGSLGKTLANTGITTWQIPAGFSGNKIASGTVGGGALQSDIINARHIQSESINTEAIQAEAITTEKLASGSVTAEKIEVGALDAVSIDAITAHIEKLTASDISTDRLAAALAAFTVITAGTADFDRATVEHLVAKALNLSFGTANEVYIDNLRVRYAQMVSAAIGNLVIKASDGNYYEIDVDARGNVSAKPTTVTDGEISTGQTDAGKVILGTNITADSLNTANLLATYALVNQIDAARIDVDTLWARDAFIAHLRTADISSNSSITLIANKADDALHAAKNATKTFRQTSQPTDEESNDGDLWIHPSTGEIRQASAASFLLDEEGVMWFNHSSTDGFKAEISADDPFSLAVNFNMTVDANGRISALPKTWATVQDQQLARKISGIGVDLEYCLWESETQQPPETYTGWNTTAPPQFEGLYIWSRTVTRLGDGSKKYGNVICLSTSLGKGVAAVIEQYASYPSKESIPQDYSGWVDGPVERLDGQYIWVRSKIIYIDGSVDYTAALCDTSWEELDAISSNTNSAMEIANAALKREDFERVVRVAQDGLHVGDNLTSCEVLIDSASVNVVMNGKKNSTFSTNFIRLQNMQVRAVTGGIAICAYKT